MKSAHQESVSPPPCLRSPLSTALIVAGIYLAFYMIYIVSSDAWVNRIATTAQDVTNLQTLKGLAFGALSTLLVFCIVFFLLRRIANAQLALDQQQRSLIAAERQAAAGLFAHSLAHDINNVLTVGMTNVEMLQMHKVLDESGTEMLADIGKSFERIHDMTRQLSRIGRTNQQHNLAELDLAKVAKEEVRYIKAHQSAHNTTIEYQGPPHALCRANESALRELLSNLLLNAAEATRGAGTIEARVKIETPSAIIEIHDNGPGVPQELRGQLFEPLYTTKEKGLGLGLLSVKSAVKLHQGQIEITDSPLGGACFKVTLPNATPAQGQS